jgi:leucyl/phenylalanyl-tRNA--protein transferase
MIFNGYREGWFPMMVNERTNETGWFQPKKRCLFPIEGIHVSKSLAKTIRQNTIEAVGLNISEETLRRMGKGKLEVRFDTSFQQVIENCRRPEGNWINDDFIRVYTEIHQQGWGHCAECWKNENLVGGVYGIAIAGVFFAESMFHRETDASKVALHALVETCRAKGFVLFDAQIMNPHLRSLGAFEVANKEYQRLISQALQVRTRWSA